MGPPAQKARPYLGSESETKNGLIFRAHNINLYVSQARGPHFWAQIPRPKMVSLFGPKIHQSRCSGRGQRMAAVLPDFVPPWRATCCRGSLGGGCLGEVLFEQQMQAAATIGDVQKHNGIKGNLHTLRDPLSSQKVGSYSEPILVSETGPQKTTYSTIQPKCAKACLDCRMLALRVVK